MVISCCSPDVCKRSTISQRLPSPLLSSPTPQQWIHLFWSFLLLHLGKLRQELGKSWGQQMLWTWMFQGQVKLGALRTGSGTLDLALGQREGRGHLFISFPVLLSVVWKSTQFANKALPLVTHKFLLVFLFMSCRCSCSHSIYTTAHVANWSLVLASAQNTVELMFYQLSATSGVWSACHTNPLLLSQVLSLLLQRSPKSTRPRAHPPEMWISPMHGSGDRKCRGAPDPRGGTRMPTGSLWGSERVSAPWHGDCVCWQVTR